MKTKLFAVLVLVLTVMTSDLFAIKVVMRGGGRNHTFYQVICKPSLISCTGVGSIVCPVSYAIISIKDDQFSASELVNYVAKKVENGETTGKEMYLDKTVVTWSVDNEDNLDIETSDGEFIVDESLNSTGSDVQTK